MAGNQKNYDYFLYVDDNGISWSKRGESGGAATAVDGHAASTSAPPFVETKRMRVRRVIYQEPTSFRTYSAIFYTAAAWAAVALGDIVAVAVQGRAASINYKAVEKVGERMQTRVLKTPPKADIP